MISFSQKQIKQIKKFFIQKKFTYKNLLKIFGKQVVRHEGISNFEKNLLHQILYDKKELYFLVRLFLTSEKIFKTELLKSFGSNFCKILLETNILKEKKNYFYSDFCIVPINNCWFFTDNYKIINKNIVFKIAQEQFYILKAFNILNNKKFIKNINGKIYDLCCGSGVLGQVISKSLTKPAVGVDINLRAANFSRINSIFNNLENKYEIINEDIKNIKRIDTNLIICNPPYNSSLNEKNVPYFLDGGYFGHEIPSHLYKIILNSPNKNTTSITCGTFLLKKNGKFLDENLNKLSNKGKLIFIHKTIDSIFSWEGLRLFFYATPNKKNYKTFLKKIKNKNITHITWGLIIFIKGKKRGIKNIYNIPQDGLLFSNETIKEIKKNI